ncbi:MAG: TetR/AcrR family transcriptional regulator [Polyangiaceae bacterium]|nr:TetR/AcrR family transcriptional regulator [Myxococcales bacterium]MCB9589991.1 TetR/AcrR family transcriptional regulator [Polyangiaceae bacterium]
MVIKTDPPSRNSTRSRRAEKKQDKRERIRAAAWDLFTRQGYAATTTKQIAKHAGIASGTLFLYAKDKPDLLCMVFQERLQRVSDAQLATIPRESCLLDQLLWVFRGVFDNYAEHQSLAREFIAVFPGSQGPNTDLLHGTTLAFLQGIAHLVMAAQRRGEVSEEVLPLQAASNIFALYFGVLLQWLSGMLDFDHVLEPTLKSALDLQLRGFYPRGIISAT